MSKLGQGVNAWDVRHAVPSGPADVAFAVPSGVSVSIYLLGGEPKQVYPNGDATLNREGYFNWPVADCVAIIPCVDTLA